MIVSKITSKGQMTIPKKIREFLNVSVLNKIEFTILEKGKVMITREQHSAKALFGMLKHSKLSSPVSVEEMNAVVSMRRLKRVLSL